MTIITHNEEGAWVRFPGTAQLDPRKIAKLVDDGIWNGNDLKKHGLKAATQFIAPEGKVAVGDEYFSADGKQQLFDVEDAPLVEVSRVPTSITPLQARKALRAVGLKVQVDAYVSTLSEEDQDEWEYATEVKRDNAIITGGAAILGLTEAQVDELFRLGSTFQ